MNVFNLKVAGSDSHPGFAGAVVVMLLLINSMTAQATPPKSAQSLLKELGPALEKTSYRGVFVYSRGDQVSSLHVVHRYRNKQVEERLVFQDGEMGEVVRRGNRVLCALPSGASLQLDAVIPSGPFAEMFSDQWAPIGRWYSIKRLADDRVAGHGAAVVAVNPEDRDRYRYRLWLEKTTGLLVKSQVLASNNDVLERFQFTMLKLTDTFDDNEFRMQSPKQVHELKLAKRKQASSRNDPLRGWEVVWRPQGFRPTAAPELHRGQAAAFSDGLASFSVFVRPQDDIDMPVGVSRIGATTVFMHKLKTSDGTSLVTVVGEIPPKTAMKIAQSVRFTDSQTTSSQ